MHTLYISPISLGSSLCPTSRKVKNFVTLRATLDGGDWLAQGSHYPTGIFLDCRIPASAGAAVPPPRRCLEDRDGEASLAETAPGQEARRAARDAGTEASFLGWRWSRQLGRRWNDDGGRSRSRGESASGPSRWGGIARGKTRGWASAAPSRGLPNVEVDFPVADFREGFVPGENAGTPRGSGLPN